MAFLHLDGGERSLDPEAVLPEFEGERLLAPDEPSPEETSSGQPWLPSRLPANSSRVVVMAEKGMRSP